MAKSRLPGGLDTQGQPAATRRTSARIALLAGRRKRSLEVTESDQVKDNDSGTQLPCKHARKTSSKSKPPKAKKGDQGKDEKDETCDPGTAVGGTFELIENIMLYLPVKKLFVVQQVNSDWRNVVGESPSVRKKTWLMPQKSTVKLADAPSETYKPGPGANLTIAPVVKLFSRHAFDPSTFKETSRLPIIATFTSIFQASIPRLKATGCLAFHFAPSKAQNGSWQQIPIFDPPPKRMILRVRTTPNADWYRRPPTINLLVEREWGLTLGDLYRGHQELIEDYEKESGNRHVSNSIFSFVDFEDGFVSEFCRGLWLRPRHERRGQ